MATHVDERKTEKRMEEHKQQMADELVLEPVDDLVELEEIVEEAKGDEEGEIPIKNCQERIKKEEKEKEKETKEKEEKLKKLKNEKQEEKTGGKNYVERHKYRKQESINKRTMRI